MGSGEEDQGVHRSVFLEAMPKLTAEQRLHSYEHKVKINKGFHQDYSSNLHYYILRCDLELPESRMQQK